MLGSRVHWPLNVHCRVASGSSGDGIPQARPHLALLGFHVQAVKVGFPGGGEEVPGQHVHGGGLTRTVNALRGAAGARALFEM